MTSLLELFYTAKTMQKLTEARTLAKIAAEIQSDWQTMPSTVAVFVQSMSRIQNQSFNSGLDSPAYLVAQFLARSVDWRGDTARRVKGELKAMLSAGEL